MHDGFRMIVARDGDRGCSPGTGTTGRTDILGKHDHEVQFYAFDMLAGDGDDMRRLPLSMRKANLQRVLARRPEGIFMATFEQGEIGPDLFRVACSMASKGSYRNTAIELTEPGAALGQGEKSDVTDNAEGETSRLVEAAYSSNQALIPALPMVLLGKAGLSVPAVMSVESANRSAAKAFASASVAKVLDILRWPFA
jgi:hypothetical protein